MAKVLDRGKAAGALVKAEDAHGFSWKGVEYRIVKIGIRSFLWIKLLKALLDEDVLSIKCEDERTHYLSSLTTSINCGNFQLATMENKFRRDRVDADKGQQQTDR